MVAERPCTPVRKPIVRRTALQQPAFLEGHGTNGLPLVARSDALKFLPLLRFETNGLIVK